MEELPQQVVLVNEAVTTMNDVKEEVQQIVLEEEESPTYFGPGLWNWIKSLH